MTLVKRCHQTEVTTLRSIPHWDRISWELELQSMSHTVDMARLEEDSPARILRVESCPRILGGADVRHALMSWVVSMVNVDSKSMDHRHLHLRRPPSTPWEPPCEDSALRILASIFALPRILMPHGYHIFLFPPEVLTSH